MALLHLYLTQLLLLQSLSHKLHHLCCKDTCSISFLFIIYYNCISSTQFKTAVFMNFGL